MQIKITIVYFPYEIGKIKKIVNIEKFMEHYLVERVVSNNMYSIWFQFYFKV